MARRQAAPSARHAPQRHAVRPSGRGCRHDVRFRDADRARGEDARARGRHDRRLGNGVEQGGRRSRAPGGGRRRRLFVHRRAAHGRNDPATARPSRLSCATATACGSRWRTPPGTRSSARSTSACASPAARCRARAGRPGAAFRRLPPPFRPLSADSSRADCGRPPVVRHWTRIGSTRAMQFPSCISDRVTLSLPQRKRFSAGPARPGHFYGREADARSCEFARGPAANSAAFTAIPRDDARSSRSCRYRGSDR